MSVQAARGVSFVSEDRGVLAMPTSLPVEETVFFTGLTRRNFSIQSVVSRLWSGPLFAAAMPASSGAVEVAMPVVQLEFLDDFNMPSEPIWGPLTPGQLSGLMFDSSLKKFLSVSDDRFDSTNKKSRGHPRYYTLSISVSQNSQTGKMEITLSDKFESTYLVDKKGDYIPFENGDGEGIVILPNGNLAIATEGQAEQGSKVEDRLLPLTSSSIDEFDRNGTWVRSYPIPSYYQPRFDMKGKQTRGVFRNNGFESLTIAGDSIFTATEGPLVQDGGAVTFERGGFTRIMLLKPKHGMYSPVKEFAYPVDAIPFPTSWGTDKPEGGENGISEMIALDENTLLVLERAFILKPYFRNHIRLYQVDLREATNTLGQKNISKDVRSVKKQLVLDFEDILPRLKPNEVQKKPVGNLENYEAMAFVNLPDGSRGLVIASDNNHNPPNQRQVFLLFRFKN